MHALSREALCWASTLDLMKGVVFYENAAWSMLKEHFVRKILYVQIKLLSLVNGDRPLNNLHAVGFLINRHG